MAGYGGGDPPGLLAGGEVCEAADGAASPVVPGDRGGDDGERNTMAWPMVVAKWAEVCLRGEEGLLEQRRRRWLVSSLLHSRTLHRKGWERAQDVRLVKGRRKESTGRARVTWVHRKPKKTATGRRRSGDEMRRPGGTIRVGKRGEWKSGSWAI